MSQIQSLGQAVKNLNIENLSKSYFLNGDDIFLQDFFINQLKKITKISSIHLFYIGYDKQEDFFNELTNLSLFNKEKIIIIKNISRLSINAKNDLLNYLSKKDPKHFLILVKNKYETRNNKFFSTLISKINIIDTRTPFENKIKDWIIFLLKKEKIKLNNSEIKSYIDAYGNNISNIMNYIKIDSYRSNSNYKISNKKYHLWNLQDSLGNKKINEAIKIYDSLVLNGTSINFILLYVFRLYEGIYDCVINLSPITKSFAINKIIQSNITLYSKKYSLNEVENIILNINKNDFLSKNYSLNINNMNRYLICNICTGFYE